MVEDMENRTEPSFTLLESLKKKAASRKELPEAYEPYSVSLGVTHTAVVTRNGDLYTCGSKADGQLGVKFASSQFQNSPINRVPLFGPHNPALQVRCGDAFCLVLASSQKVFSFGKGTHGKLGIGPEVTNLPEQCIHEPVQVKGLSKIVDISAGCRHAAAINGKFLFHLQRRARSTPGASTSTNSSGSATQKRTTTSPSGSSTSKRPRPFPAATSTPEL